MRASQFEQFAPHDARTVFLGDSITAGGLWQEWFPTVSLVNRGIDGDMSDGVLARLGTAVSTTTRRVFLLIGTNDLTLGTPIDEIVENVREILRGIRTVSPDAQLVLQSVMPRDAQFRPAIEELNGRYRALAEEIGTSFLELWPALADEHGELRSEFTLDALHLNGAGYAAWVELLRPFVLR